MSVDLLLRAFARTMPAASRDRYLEQWRADAAGAEDAGLRRGDVVRGALAVVATADRDAPRLTGEPRGAAPRRLSRRGVSVALAAAVLAAALWVTGGRDLDSAVRLDPGFAAGIDAARVALEALAGCGIALAAAYVIGAAVVSRRAIARIAFGSAALGLLMLMVATIWSDAAAVSPLALGLAVGGIAVGLAAAWRSTALALVPRSAPVRERWPLAVLGVTAVASLIALGAVDTLVWNPRAKVPGLTIGEIYDEMIAADGFSPAFAAAHVAAWAAIWLLASLFVAVFALSPAGAWLTPRRLGILFLTIVGAALFFRLFAGFSIGMSLADTFWTSGADESPLSLVFQLVGPSAVAVAAILFGWAPAAREQAEPVPAT
ncbi:hypothetical protein [Microbacterium oleivorans]|uniref:Uncharacterized protein n=1 Tax=Microbacterium oleivorans TaxID=273677 RepID=A0A7D5EXD4_9MICO|nr:hypothetical protein [Microbacterium oleivorans]QLD12286.1 hypothetical protein HW566_11180 [Microbacterium oleivorans]